MKCPFLITRSNVDFGGLKHAADIYYTSSCFVGLCLMMPLAIDFSFIFGRGVISELDSSSCVGCFLCTMALALGVFLVSRSGVDYALDKGISHNPLSLRLPSMMTLLFFKFSDCILKIMLYNRHHIIVL